MKEIIDIAILVGFVAFVLAIPISIYVSIKQDGRDWDKRKKDMEDWLAAELKKPKASIEFVTLDDEVRTTGPHEPYITNPGSDWGYKSASKDFADRCLKGAYERGFFMDEKHVSYPACNIKSAKVVVK